MTTIIKNLIKILFLFIICSFGTAYATNASDLCTKDQGSGQCTPAKLLISDWVYAFGSSTYTSESAALGALLSGYSNSCMPGGCATSQATGWPTTTPINAPLDPGSVLSAFDQETNLLWTQKKAVMLNFPNGQNWKFELDRMREIKFYCPPSTYLVSDLANPNGYPLHKNWQCYNPNPVPADCNKCNSTAHPVTIATGNKTKPQLDWTAQVGPLRLNRTYNSSTLSNGNDPC